MNLEKRLLELSSEQWLELLHILGERGPDLKPQAASDAGKAASRDMLVLYYTLEPAGGAATTDVVCKVTEGIPEPTLRDYCHDRLLPHMRPARYVALNRFPLLPNGKLSYADLPAPPSTRGSVESLAASDDDAVLSKLTSILSDLLGMASIRGDDNFFEIGGDSITAIQLVSRVREAGLHLDVGAVSSSGSIAELASWCKTSLPVMQDEPAGSEQAADHYSSQFSDSGMSEAELDDYLQAFE